MSARSHHSSASMSSGGSAIPDRVYPSGNTIADESSVEELGRTFNSYRAGKYLLPNDSVEQDRLDVQHRLFELLLHESLAWAPLGLGPQNVLDIGTGTGIWAIKYALKNPTSTVIGSDLSLIQPPKVPPNCVFVREDAEEDWIYDIPFDFVHLRMMFTCFTKPQEMMRKIFHNLKPGGWVEYQDLLPELLPASDDLKDLVENSATSEMYRLMAKGAAGTDGYGRDIMITHKYKSWLIEAGFVDVVEEQVLCPYGPWPIDLRDFDLGRWLALDALSALGGFSKMVIKGGMPEEQVPALQDRVRAEIVDTEFKAYLPFYVVYGRKPHDGESATPVSERAWAFGFKGGSCAIDNGLLNGSSKTLVGFGRPWYGVYGNPENGMNIVAPVLQATANLQDRCQKGIADKSIMFVPFFIAVVFIVLGFLQMKKQGSVPSFKV